MKVKELIELLNSPAPLILKGSHSGKIYYNSEVNTLKTRKKYEEYECCDKPIDVIIKSAENMAYPVIILWFRDYELTKQE